MNTVNLKPLLWASLVILFPLTVKPFEPLFNSRLDYQPAIENFALFNGIAADFNGDTYDDILYTGNLGLCIMLNSGNGTFAEPIYLGFSPFIWWLHSGDFNGDGYVDFVYFSTMEVKLKLVFNDGNANFYGQQNLGDSQPISVADFDNNGCTDIVFRKSDSIYVLWFDSTGSFYEGLSSFVEGGASGFIDIDLNSDIYLDLAFTNIDSSTVGVLQNSGTGVFASAVYYDISLHSIAPIDFNGDGALDIIGYDNTNNSFAYDSLIILLNDGDGSLEFLTRFDAVENAKNFIVADFNNDDFDDIVIVDDYLDGPWHLNTYINTQNNTLELLESYTIGQWPRSLASGIFDGNTDVGVAVLNRGQYSSNISVLLNSGAGSFHQSVKIGVGSYPVDILAVDLNDDAKPDLVTSDNGADSISIIFNDGDGLFSVVSSLSVGVNPKALTYNDLDKNGHTDLVVANSGSDDISILLGLGGGAFNTAINLDMGSYPVAVKSGNLNEDTYPDLVVLNQESNTFAVMLNLGDGLSFDITNYTLTYNNSGLFLADFDVDNDLDIAVTYGDLWGGTSIFVNNGQGEFSSTVVNGYYGYLEAVHDLNGDLLPDLILFGGIHNDFITIRLNDGNGYYSYDSSYSIEHGIRHILVSDIDGNGTADIVVTNRENSNINVLFGYGDGTFDLPFYYSYGVGSFPESACAVDLDGDGGIDLATANVLSNNVSILFNLSGPYSCCAGITGNVDGSGDNQIDIADIVYFIDYSFNLPPGPEPPCMDEADVNGDYVIDIGDIVYLIDYSFSQPPGPAPVECP